MAEDEGVLTDLDSMGADPGNAPGNGMDDQPTAGFVTQYVKDLSVENPRAPKSFRFTEAPALDVQFNIDAKPVEGDDLHEVGLNITCTARTPEGVAYIVELTYCGLVGMRNMPEDQAHMFLYSEAPRILFPFARAVVADAVRDAGFPPLMLDPIDFQGLYIQQLQQRRAEGAEGLPPEGPAQA